MTRRVIKRCPICRVETVGGKTCISHNRGRAERHRAQVDDLHAQRADALEVIQIVKDAINQARKPLRWRPYRRSARRLPSGAPAPLRLPAKL